MKISDLQVTGPARWKTLVADDCAEECQLLEAYLSLIPEIQTIGFVHDGGEAIEYLTGLGRFGDREGFPYPDLLLLDFRMPVLDGLQVLAALKPRSERPSIILWSNTLLDLNQELALSLGADLVCNKPTGLAELRRLLARLDGKLELERVGRKRFNAAGPGHRPPLAPEAPRVRG
jgi:CheY-like chemotaxis protein